MKRTTNLVVGHDTQCVSIIGWFFKNRKNENSTARTTFVFFETRKKAKYPAVGSQFTHDEPEKYEMRINQRTQRVLSKEKMIVEGESDTRLN